MTDAVVRKVSQKRITNSKDLRKLRVILPDPVAKEQNNGRRAACRRNHASDGAKRSCDRWPTACGRRCGGRLAPAGLKMPVENDVVTVSTSGG